MNINRYLCVGTIMLLGTVTFARAQSQYQMPYYPGDPYYRHGYPYYYQMPFYSTPLYYAPPYYGIWNRPPSWSYDPYTSGLGPCPQRRPSDPPCKDTIAPTFGQPSYWPR